MRLRPLLLVALALLCVQVLIGGVRPVFAFPGYLLLAAGGVTAFLAGRKMPRPQIICASANPAMDRRLHMASLSVGEINRAQSAEGFAGGKAAHVAMAARAFDP